MVEILAPEQPPLAIRRQLKILRLAVIRRRHFFVNGEILRGTIQMCWVARTPALALAKPRAVDVTEFIGLAISVALLMTLC